MADDWYVRGRTKVYGPFSAEQIKQLARNGKISDRTPVRQGRKGPWTPAGRVRGLLEPAPGDADADFLHGLSQAVQTETSAPSVFVQSGDDGASVVTASRDARRWLCPQCGRRLQPGLTACRRCKLSLREGVCSVCGKKVRRGKRCDCRVPPIVRVRKTRRVLCAACGRDLPWRAKMCARCAMDYHIERVPAFRRRNHDHSPRHGPVAELGDSQRIQRYRVCLAQARQDMKKRRSALQWAKLVSFGQAILGMSLLGPWYIGVAAMSDARRQREILAGSSDVHRMRLILLEFHRQTEFQYATLFERWVWGPWSLLVWFGAVCVFLLLLLAMVLIAVVAS